MPFIMITINIISDETIIPVVIDYIKVIIDWQCGNCYRINIIDSNIESLPKCGILTDDGKICKRQIPKL